MFFQFHVILQYDQQHLSKVLESAEFLTNDPLFQKMEHIFSKTIVALN